MHNVEQLPKNPWVCGLALVRFDIDQGQLIEQLYPSKFTKKEEKSIAMLSFPDSNSFDSNEGILTYIFKVKLQNGKSIYGFVCFKQKRDLSVSRGYFQKSLVILTQLPFVSFFPRLAEFLVFRLFNQELQKISLLTIYDEISKWPIPEPLNFLTLSVINHEFNIKIPTFKKEHFSSEYKKKNLQKMEKVDRMGNFQQVKLLESFKHIIPSLWSIWQIVLLNKPLMIISNNAHIVSNAVLGAISLVSPLEFICDYKPYMTVYDDDFHAIQKMINQDARKISRIIGVTNPLFLKNLSKFPNILSLSNTQDSKGMVTRIRKDQYLCQLIQDMVKSGAKDEMIQSMLKSHFLKLTWTFMQRFEAYFEQQKSDLKHYDKEEFLKFLKNQKIQVDQCFQSKRSLIKLYSQFVDSSNFHQFVLSRNVIKTF